jgi:hypothetical protein
MTYILSCDIFLYLNKKKITATDGYTASMKERREVEAAIKIQFEIRLIIRANFKP